MAEQARETLTKACGRPEYRADVRHQFWEVA
jgi:hypothetical protein